MKAFSSHLTTRMVNLASLTLFTIVIGLGLSVVSPAPSVSASPPVPPPGISTGNGVWFWQNPLPQGNRLNGLACAPGSTNLCFAAGEAGTILRTSNRGTNWSIATTGVSNNLKRVSCLDATNCVAVGSSGMTLYSSDGGVTWTFNSPLTANDLNGVSCVAATTTCLAVGAGGTILRTTDSGATWANPVTGSATTDNLYGISCLNIPPINCLAVGGNGGGAMPSTNVVIASVDGGVNWALQNTTPATYFQPFYDVTCGSATECYAVGDFGIGGQTTALSGGTWTSLNLPATCGGFGCSTTRLNAVSCAGSTCYAAGAGGRTFSISSPTTTWTYLATPLDLRTNLYGLTCASGPALVCIAGGDYGRLLGLTGTTWADQTSGTLNGTLSGISCLTAVLCLAAGSRPNGTATDGLILGTNDRGATWVSLFPSIAAPFDAAFAAISCLNTSPDFSCVAVGSRYDGISSTLLNIIYVTTDSANTWARHTVLNGPLQSVSCALSGPASFNCYTVGGVIIPGGYAGEADNVIYQSTDNGANWAALSVPVGYGDALRGISCPEYKTCLAVGGDYTAATPRVSIIGTTNGIDWTLRLSRPAATSLLNGITCPNPQVCYAVGGDFSSTTGGRVEATLNGGATSADWTTQTLPNVPELKSVSCITVATCYAVGRNGIVLATTTRGEVWSDTLAHTSTTTDLYGLSCQVACYTVGLGGAILSNAIFVEDPNDDGTLTTTYPYHLSYALQTARSGQAIVLNSDSGKVLFTGSIGSYTFASQLKAGVVFGAPCGPSGPAQSLSVNGQTADLTLEGNNTLVGIEFKNLGGRIFTGGTANSLACLRISH